MYKLHRFLVDYDMTMLRALAQNRGVALTTNRQAEAVDELAFRLLDPLSMRTALARLSPGGCEALEVLLAAGGRMRAPHFARRFGQVQPIGPGRLERETRWLEPANPAEELWYAGLIFRAFHQDEVGPGEFLFIPEDLLPLLPQPKLAPPAFAVEIVSTPPPRQPDDLALIYDLFAYLVYLQNHDVRPYADGRLAQHDQVALRQRLANTDDRRFALLSHLARRLGFVIQSGGYLRLEARPVKQWLTATSAHQLAVLQGAWRDDPTWNDLCRVPALACDQETPWQNDSVATRRALLALLGHCPLGVWWTSDSFIAAVKETHPDFQRPDGDYTSWYLHDPVSGDYLSGFEAWDRVEGALIADLLTGPLSWLGIVATGETGTVCCLTEAGARFLGPSHEEPEEQPSPPIIVHPDFRIEIPPPANLYTRFQVERFTDPSSPSSSGQRPQAREVRTFHLTVGSLGRALARGVRIEQVLAFLQQVSERPVPPNVVGQLHLWAGRFGQVELEEVTVLRVKNEQVLKELSLLPETRSLIGEVLSPTSVLVRKRDIARLRKELQALGYLQLEE